MDREDHTDIDYRPSIDMLFGTLAAQDELRRNTLALIVCLRSQLDAIEAAVVTDSRRSGVTWAEIGTSLAVTRQAASQRHDRRSHRNRNCPSARSAPAPPS
jgi:hypothetical protein